MNGVWEVFHKKYNYYPPNEWHLGAIFGGDRSVSARQTYRQYLEDTAPTPNQRKHAPVNLEQWILAHMGLEFGIPGKHYKLKGGKTYIPPVDINFSKITWYKTLQVKPTADWDAIRQSYLGLMKIYHPDTTSLPEHEAKEASQMLNLAYEQAKKLIKPDEG